MLGDGRSAVTLPISTNGAVASANRVVCVGDAATTTPGVGVTMPDSMTTAAGEANTELPVLANDTAAEAPSVKKDDARLSCWLGVAYPTNRGGVNDALIFGGVMVATSAGKAALWSKLCSKPWDIEDCDNDEACGEIHRPMDVEVDSVSSMGCSEEHSASSNELRFALCVLPSDL